MSPRVRLAVLTLVMLGGAAGQVRSQTGPSVLMLDRWVTAVREHVPGHPDAAVASVVSLTYDARRDLNTAMPLFLAVLRGGIAAVPNNAAARRVANIARAIIQTPGSAEFLERAAVLHADCVAFAGKFPKPDPGPRSTPHETMVGRARLRGSTDDIPPLLWNAPTVLTQDGELIGATITTWHLPFARSLLDVLLERAPSPADYDFTGEWYHAVAALLFANGMFGDATSHLTRGEQVLPGDPRQAFDRGTYAETLGLPLYQAVADSADTRVPPEGRTNGDAEKLYRRALEIDPGYTEARVRLARLLDHRGRHDEAAVEIDGALESKPSGVVAFYAHLVAGRVAMARGRHDEALQQYRNALTLFGDAQSALLGASHAALMAADVPNVLAPLDRLGGAFETDPWRDYQMGAGRDVNDLMAHLWARAQKGRP